MSCLGEAFPSFGSGKISLLEVSLYRDSFSTQTSCKIFTSLSMLAEDRCASPQPLPPLDLVISDGFKSVSSANREADFLSSVVWFFKMWV